MLLFNASNTYKFVVTKIIILNKVYFRALVQCNKEGRGKKCNIISRGVRVRLNEDRVPSQSYHAIKTWFGSGQAPENISQGTMELWMDAHRAQFLTGADLYNPGVLVVCMTSEHRRIAQEQFPNFSNMRMLSHDGSDVDDPYKGTNERYEECFSQIRELCDVLWKQIRFSDDV